MRPLTVTLPDDLVEEIEARVARGDYASESELVRASLESQMDAEFELEKHEVARIRASYDEMKAHPSRGIAVDEIAERVRRRVLGTG